jgi:hypothetical protein
MMSKTIHFSLFYLFTLFKLITTLKVAYFFPDPTSRFNFYAFLCIGRTVQARIAYDRAPGLQFSSVKV